MQELGFTMIWNGRSPKSANGFHSFCPQFYFDQS